VRTLIDETHSNSFTIWKAQGSPQKPTAAQIQEMEEASKLAKVANPAEITTKGGVCELKFPLARQGVTLLELEWK
jgi:xylan 1,4-beta-xylosidase